MRQVFGLIKGMKPRELILFSGYAFYLSFSYMVFHSATMLSSGGGFGFDTQTFFMIAIGIGRVLVFLLAGCFSRFVEKLSNLVLVTIVGAVAVMGFLVIGMIFQFSPFLPGGTILPWLMLGGILLGLGDAALTLLWARFSTTFSLRAVYLYVVLSNIVSLALYFLITLLPQGVDFPAAAAFFIVSVAFVKKSLDARPVHQGEVSPPVLSRAIRGLLQPIVGTVILCFMSGLMLQISGQIDVPLENFQQTALLTSAIVVLLLLLPSLLVKKPLNIGRIYSMALPLSAAGFLLLPLIWNSVGGLANSFAQLGAMVAGIILWCILANLSQDTKLPPTLLFGIALACTETAVLAGTIVGRVNAETLQQGDLVLTIVALVAVYLLFMAALFLFKDKSLKGMVMEIEGYHPEQESTSCPEAQLSERCSAIATRNRFTPREEEIFVLLAQGFTIPVISEKLFVSENTVKSHAKSIYQKLGIHARTELIELVNTE